MKINILAALAVMAAGTYFMIKDTLLQNRTEE